MEDIFGYVILGALGRLYLLIRFRDAATRKKYLDEKWDGKIAAFGWSLIIRTFFVVLGLLVVALILVAIYKTIFR